MKPKSTYRLGDLQLRILKILWEKGEISVAEVHEELGTGRFAYTTIATMLRKMEQRGLVAHRSDERRFLYKAAVPEESVSTNMAGHLIDRLFEGSLSNLVHHLLDTRDVTAEELKSLEKLIAERRRSL